MYVFDSTITCAKCCERWPLGGATTGHFDFFYVLNEGPVGLKAFKPVSVAVWWAGHKQLRPCSSQFMAILYYYYWNVTYHAKETYQCTNIHNNGVFSSQQNSLNADVLKYFLKGVILVLGFLSIFALHNFWYLTFSFRAFKKSLMLQVANFDIFNFKQQQMSAISAEVNVNSATLTSKIFFYSF